MQRTKDNTNYREIKQGAETYVMTDNQFTQPPIFNLIKGTKYRGIWYGAFSIIAILILNPEYYIYLIPADLIMMLGFLNLRYLLLPDVLLGRVKKVAPLNKSNVSIGGVTISILRSAFIRFLVLMAYLIYEAYYYNEFALLYKNANTGILIGCTLLGLLIYWLSRNSLMKPNTFDVRDYHFQVLRYCNHLTKKDEPKVEIPKQEIKYYGQPDASNLPQAPKVSYPKYNNKSNEVKENKPRNPRPANQQNVNNEQKDVFENKRVNRRRRNV